jgi:hypothetical protein
MTQPHNVPRTSPLPATGAVRSYAFLRQTLLVLSLGLIAGPSWADDCDVPVQQWQSREAVRQMAADKGWQLQRLKIDDGCYEIRGLDAEGQAFKAKIDPQTLAIVKIKRRDHDRDRKDRDHKSRDGQRTRDAAPAPATPRN